MQNKGFTLIELLVAIAIIAILSSVVLTSLWQARENANIAKARSELRSMVAAIHLLEADTGKWPHGCPVPTDPFDLDEIGNVEENLDHENIGLSDMVAIETQTDPGTPECRWTTQDIQEWRGPYMIVSNDPWGNPYVFDPDYFTDGTVRGNCGGPTAARTTVLFSRGPNESAPNAYDCDDIVYVLGLGTFAI